MKLRLPRRTPEPERRKMNRWARGIIVFCSTQIEPCGPKLMWLISLVYIIISSQLINLQLHVRGETEISLNRNNGRYLHCRNGQSILVALSYGDSKPKS